MYRNALPQLSGQVFLTDSGLETDLIFNEGFDLPEFASFVLVDDADGAAALEAYFRRHVDIAVQHGCGVILEAPTWRASRDWGARIGYPAAELRRVNQAAVDLLSRVQGGHLDSAGSPVVLSGCIGPRADAYRPAECMGEDEAEDYQPSPGTRPGHASRASVRMPPGRATSNSMNRRSSTLATRLNWPPTTCGCGTDARHVKAIADVVLPATSTR